MGFDFLLTKEARHELFEAIEYYNGLDTKYAFKFLKDFEAARELLRVTPYFQIRYGDIRTYKLKKFPYILYYYFSEEENIVLVTQIRHAKSHRR
ncbi:MAG: hypothetical protein Kapaf2KO_20940 [Candidatus Kapaibacteriales bacterium]